MLPNTKYYYRPDIDGLRAISIAAVVTYHFFEKVLPHGYLGVDVFFVISGFLIAGIIKRELENSSFSIIEFIKKRVARLFPALLTVFIFTISISYFIMSTEEFYDLLNQIIYGSFYIINFFLYFRDDYFAAYPFEITFLHLWSLSVEEQFYLLFPLFMIFTFFIAKGEKSKIMIFLIVLVISISLMFMLNERSMRFYFPWARAWEFIMGALLSISFSRKKISLDNRASDLLAATGLAMMITPMFLKSAFDHPGIITFFPVLGASIAILFTPESRYIRRILSSYPIVFIGIISYPLYLWHYSLFSIAQYALDIHLSPKIHGPIFIAISIFLAWLTWKYIETPLRRNADRTALPLFLSMCALGLFSLALLQWQVKTPLKDQLVIKAVKATKDWSYPHGLKRDKHKAYRSQTPGPVQVVMVGDSHMEQYAPRMVKLEKERRERVIPYAFTTISGCPFIEEAVWLSRPKRCSSKIKRIFSYLAEHGESLRAVVIASAWNLYFIQPSYGIPCDGKVLPMHKSEGFDCAMQKFRYTLKKVRQLAPHAKIYLVLDIPADNKMEPRWYLKLHSKLFLSSTRLASSLGLINTRRKPVFHNVSLDKRQRKVARKMRENLADTGVHFIDPVPFICPEGFGNSAEYNVCSPIFNKPDKDWYFKYKDDDHINSTFAETLSFLDHLVLKDGM